MNSPLAVISIAVCCGTAWAQVSDAGAAIAAVRVPLQIRFTGSLTDATGKPLTGPQALTFSIYTDRTGTTAVWQETQRVTADLQGRYAVELGRNSGHRLPLALFTSGEMLFLGVQAHAVTTPAEIRTAIVSVPYALKAGDTDTLAGKPASAYVRREESITNLPAQTDDANTAITAGAGLGGRGTAAGGDLFQPCSPGQLLQVEGSAWTCTNFLPFPAGAGILGTRSGEAIAEQPNAPNGPVLLNQNGDEVLSGPTPLSLPARTPSGSLGIG